MNEVLNASHKLLAAMKGGMGIVLLHGKRGFGNDAVIRPLASKLVEEGYAIEMPTLPWSSRRIYDKSVDGSLPEIDVAAEKLRNLGAKKIVIAGFSLGGSVAIRYVAMRDQVDGLIALAPAQHPDRDYNRKKFKGALDEARALIADSKEDAEGLKFLDDHMGKDVDVRVTPGNYVTWWSDDDKGALVGPRNLASFKRAVPFLYVVGKKDLTTRPQDELFDKAPPHKLSAYVSLDTDHYSVPEESWPRVQEWLEKLDAEGQAA